MLTKKAPILIHDVDVSPYDKGYNSIDKSCHIGSMRLNGVLVKYKKYGSLCFYKKTLKLLNIHWLRI